MLLLLALAGCTDKVEGPVAPGGEVVHFDTDDGVRLEADWYAPSGTDFTGVLLLHMNPQRYDRTNWPASFVVRLHEGHDWGVLVPDRRGTGGSEGEPEDAFEGEGGRLDTDACVSFMVDQGMESLAVVGASNGTTSMVDWSVWAATQDRPRPGALGFMSGGTYTENQTPMEDVAALGTPAIFTYPPEEAEWAEEQEALDPGAWEWHEYPDGAHGTGMFEAAPEVADDLDAFLTGWLP